MTDLEMLELAAYKIGEMLRVGDFEESHEENFRRAYEKIQAHLAAASEPAA